MTTCDGDAPTFDGVPDRYDGVTVDSADESCDTERFESKLLASLDEWTLRKKRAIWFRVDLRRADWIPVLIRNGFKYHHARDDSVTLYRWLPDDSCGVPPFAHTLIGVGAVVVNDADEILTVREKYPAGPPFWKLPGGYVEPNEELAAAAIREVKEETDIDAEFDSLLSLRHVHGASFRCSDLYVVFSLRPLSNDPPKCDREIAECSWMPVVRYLDSPDVHELNKYFVRKYIEYKENDVKIELVEGVHQLSKKPYTVFGATVKKRR